MIIPKIQDGWRTKQASTAKDKKAEDEAKPKEDAIAENIEEAVTLDTRYQILQGGEPSKEQIKAEENEETRKG